MAIAEVSIKISREKLQNGCCEPDSVEVVDIINPNPSQKEREKFIEAAAEFLWYFISKDIKTDER